MNSYFKEKRRGGGHVFEKELVTMNGVGCLLMPLSVMEWKFSYYDSKIVTLYSEGYFCTEI